VQFATERPYPPTGLTSQCWAELQTRWMYFHQLTTTQSGVLLEPLLCGSEPYSGDFYPHVVRWEGGYYLEDGHTRVARAVLQGKEGMYCRVFDSAQADGDLTLGQDVALP
jgi:hypothetical protein